jgi:putative ABC transport system permease protein
MNIRDNFADAVEQLTHHKLRTLLTLLGMIFGVGAVISMISVGEGAEREALSLIDSLGVRNVLVEEREVDNERLKEVRKHSIGLSLQDIYASLDTLPFVDTYSASKNIEVHSMFSREGRSDASVLGVTTTYFELSRLEIATGRAFNEPDSQLFKQVAILGPQVALNLFPKRDAVGKLIKINHVWLQVVGVLKEKHLSKKSFQGVALGGESNRIYLPLKTALKRYNFRDLDSELDSFRLELQAGIDPTIASGALSHLLLQRHNKENDFDIIVPAALLNQHKKTQKIFNVIMSCVAGISLLVGGIGIMNIMLATVLERTKEIGLRRAVGAKRRHIREQFMIESFTIAAVGGVLGIVFGVALSLGISLFAGWPVAWSFSAIVVSVVFCATVGLVFGIYPAIKASELDPITALQGE